MGQISSGWQGLEEKLVGMLWGGGIMMHYE